MNDLYRHYENRRVVTKEERVQQSAQMIEDLQRAEAKRLAEVEASRLADEEQKSRWAKTYAEMNLDDVIEIPGRSDGKDILFRMRPVTGGHLETIEVVPIEPSP